MIVVHGETLWSPAPQPMDDDDSNGIKNPLKCIFQETVPKLSVNVGNRNSQDSHKTLTRTDYSGPVLNFGFTEPQ